jgi:hypothetical protein
MHRWLAFATVASAIALGSCKGGGGDTSLMTLPKTSFSTGEWITVNFASPIKPPANEQYWLTLVEAGKPDSEWGNWHYLDNGDTTDAKLMAPDPGNYEVRLHDSYPRLQFHVVARKAVTVTAGSGAAPSAAPSASH